MVVKKRGNVAKTTGHRQISSPPCVSPRMGRDTLRLVVAAEIE